jgi:hypothetical protein
MGQIVLHGKVCPKVHYEKVWNSSLELLQKEWLLIIGKIILHGAVCPKVHNEHVWDYFLDL